MKNLSTISFEKTKRRKETLLTRILMKSKVASVILNGSIQTYKDKQAIVADSETILLFQQKVKILEPQRKRTGKRETVPSLCGAIHHPYASSIPFPLMLKKSSKRRKKK